MPFLKITFVVIADWLCSIIISIKTLSITRYIASVPTCLHIFILSVFPDKDLDSRVSFGARGRPQEEISESLHRKNGRRGPLPYLQP
jgi:hypothetical protein